MFFRQKKNIRNWEHFRGVPVSKGMRPQNLRYGGGSSAQLSGVRRAGKPVAAIVFKGQGIGLVKTKRAF
jgi:hypothetical protein